MGKYYLLCAFISILFFLVLILIVFSKIKQSEKSYVLYKCKFIFYVGISVGTFFTVYWVKNGSQLFLNILVCIISFLECVSNYREYKILEEDTNQSEQNKKTIIVKDFVKKCQNKSTDDIWNFLEQYDAKAIIKLRADLAFEIARKEVWTAILSYVGVMAAILSVFVSVIDDPILKDQVVSVAFSLLLLVFLAVVITFRIVKKSIYCRTFSYVESYIQQSKIFD